MPDADTVDRIVSCVGDLPAMPSIVAETLRLTDDPKTDIARISEIIQADPAMTAKILRVSNSPYYGMKQYVGTLKLAMVILGVREVRNIVLGISVFEVLSDGKSDSNTVRDIWDYSLKLAAVAKNLGSRLGLGLQGEEFITGLLSDMGKMVLLRTLGKVYATMLKENALSPTQLCLREMEEAGCTHADVAMALAIRWNLPQGLADALWRQYPREDLFLRDASDPGLAAVIRVSKAALLDDFSSDEPLTSLQDTEAWDVLAKARNPLPHEARRDLLFELIESLKDMPTLPL